jgi:uncharacterized protein with GYD domain
MALFMVQAAYTSEALAKMAKSPENRETALRGLVERAGGRLHNLYFTFGQHDIMAIFEAPDAKSASAVAVAASAAGHLKATQTTELLTAAEGIEVFKKAGGLAYQAPKG